MVHSAIYGPRDDIAWRSNYWKLPANHRYYGHPSELRELIDSSSGGGKHYTSSTDDTRMKGLLRRIDRGLRCYDGDSRMVLRMFCNDRKLARSLQRANKAVLIQALEKADEEATFDHFLDLPPELRVHVYEWYCKGFTYHASWNHMTSGALMYPSPPPITQICSTIRHESLPCFFQMNTFYFLLVDNLLGNVFLELKARQYLRIMPAEFIAMVRHLCFVTNFRVWQDECVDTKLSIDMGTEHQQPRVQEHMLLPYRNTDVSIEKDLEPLVHDFVRSMAGRCKDDKLLASDFYDYVKMYTAYRVSQLPAVWDSDKD